MQRYPNALIVIAVCLAALAGFVDALAFSALGLFASFMSGNSTRLGVALAQNDWPLVRLVAALLLAFIAGVIGSSVVARRWPLWRKPAVMAGVTLLLVLAAATERFLLTAPILMLAAAMGAANGVFTREGEVAIGVTYMTGSLVRLGQRLAAALMGEGERWSWVPYAALWAGFVAGVVLGARAYLDQGLDSLWMAVLGSTAITAALVRLGRTRPLVSVPPSP